MYGLSMVPMILYVRLYIKTTYLIDHTSYFDRDASKEELELSHSMKDRGYVFNMPYL